MRFYENLVEALSEIRRDLYKGPRVTSTRVQQRKNEELEGRELLAYSYTIEQNGIPESVDEVIAIGKDFEFKPFSDVSMRYWLSKELLTRVSGKLNTLNEPLHPALSSVIEGNWPSYTYGERLHGAVEAIVSALKDSPDSRRAYWPIYEQHDALRAAAPTRIPCSLGYQFLIRNTLQSGPQLVMMYLQRSADFDIFFLSDIWLANQFQRHIASRLEIPSGQFTHVINSLHSFTVEGTEIY